MSALPAIPPVNTTLTFIHLNDLHAHLTEHDDWIKPTATEAPRLVKAGGIARIATAIDQIRASNPSGNILMNIGDTFHGGVEALYSNGNVVVDIINTLGVDLGVPGNWDYAYGFNATRLRFSSSKITLPMTEGEIRKVNYPNLAANVTSKPLFPEFLPATRILTRNGAKIGFIGLSSDMVPKMHKMMALSFKFLQGEQEYIDLINHHAQQLRQDGVNMVVVMSELGIHKDLKIAEKIHNNSVDVIFSAHTHELTRTPIETASGAQVVEAGSDIYLGRMDITLQNGKITQRQWQIITVDAQYPERQDIAQQVAAIRQDLKTNYAGRKVPMAMTTQTLDHDIEAVIGHTTITLDRRHALVNRFNQVYTQLLKNYAGTDVALTPGFRFDSVIPGTDIPVEDQPASTGAITIEDIYRYFPMPFTLATGEIPAKGTLSRFGKTGKKDIIGLDTIIENNLTAVFSTDIFQQVGGWTDGFAGITLQVNLQNADGKRITQFYLTDAPTETLTANTILSVAGCSRPMDEEGTLCSYSGFKNVQPLLNPATGKAWSGIDFIIAEITAGHLENLSELTATITDTSATAMWPDSPYIQPLYGAQ